MDAARGPGGLRKASRRRAGAAGAPRKLVGVPPIPAAKKPLRCRRFPLPREAQSAREARGRGGRCVWCLEVMKIHAGRQRLISTPPPR